MLKKVEISQLIKGIYIQELCGNWIDVPFWKKSFLIDSDILLEQVKNCGVEQVWIDTDKGCDIVEMDSMESIERMENTVITPCMPFKYTDVTAVAMSKEYDRAANIIAKSREAVTNMFNEARAGKFGSLQLADVVVDEIAQSVIRNQYALVTLSRLKQFDDFTYMHSIAVCAMMVALAKKLEMSDADIRLCGKAGLLHDIGKMTIPPEILNKPGKLTDEEFSIVKEHPWAGHKMLLEAGNISEVALDVCLHHHEKINGKGYPYGLIGEEISIYARMGAVCDVYDAITSNRPYKSGWCPALSLRKMAQWAKEGHFDAVIFSAFIKCVGIYPIGTLLKLKSGRLAVVTDVSKSLVRPLVKVFYSTKSMTYIQPVIVDLSLIIDAEDITGIESAEKWGFVGLEKYWN